MATIKIGKHIVGENHPTFIIAEAGINHQGEMEIAKKLIDVASFAGATAVKFQKRKLEKLLTKDGINKPYENANSFGKTYGEHRLALELSESDFVELKKYSEEKGLVFMASGWDEDSVDFLASIDIPAFKMASCDLTNLPLLEHTAKKGKPIILSTGMSTLADIERALATVLEYTREVALMQCTSTYPCPFEDIHLNVLTDYQRRYPQCVIGYSGHELGIAIPVGAVALGAKLVERHFTLDRTMKGGDHAASLEPEGLRKMVRDIRAIEKALGTEQKIMAKGEDKVQAKLAKSVTTAVKISKGTVITREMLTFKSPGDGIPPYDWTKVVGKTVRQDVDEDTQLKWDQVQ